MSGKVEVRKIAPLKASPVPLRPDFHTKIWHNFRCNSITVIITTNNVEYAFSYVIVCYLCFISLAYKVVNSHYY